MREDIDGGVREVLTTLDPERMDPGYWHRFHRWSMNSAGAELVRRRRGADASVSGVMLSWWRTLVPTAVVAAILAGFFLLRDGTPLQQPLVYMSVDELILDGIDVPVMPAFETADSDGGIVVVNEAY